MGEKNKPHSDFMKRIRRFDRHRLFLILIYLLTFSFMLVYSFQTEEFSSSSSYTTLRHVENILKEGTPLYYDPLSYGGREHVTPPFFYYVLAFFSLFMPVILAAKIIPALLGASTVIIIYFIAKKISSNKKVALLSSFMSGFIPVSVSLMLNTVTPYSLAIPLFLLSFYLFTRIDEGKKFVLYFVIAFLFSLLTHPITLLLVLSLLIYVSIIKIEKMDTTAVEIELIIFSAFFMLWTYFIIYKHILLTMGPSIIWQNMPLFLRKEYFMDFNILQAMINIGLIPFVFGMYIVYVFFFRYRSKTNFLYISVVFAVLLALWLRVIELKVGLTLLAIFLVLLFSFFYKNFLIYLEKTKFSRHTMKILIGILLLFTITSVVPTFLQADNNINSAFTMEDSMAMEWMRDNIEPGSTVLSTAYDGSFISFKTGMKNVADTDFLMVKDVEERIQDIEEIYTTAFETDAVPLMTKYNVDYILFNSRVQEEYDLSSIRYVEKDRCFWLIYDHDIKIYRLRCTIQESRGDTE